MPRADIAALDAWRAEFQAERAQRDRSVERWVQGWSRVVLVLFVLYAMIGSRPFAHEIYIDPETGGSDVVSPANRLIWLALGAMSLPLLWARRALLAEAAKRLWLLLAVFGWFMLSTRWALDPVASNRRIFQYIVAFVICLGVALGFGGGRRLHLGLAISCAAMVAIDLVSWILLPGVSMTDLGLAAIHGQKNTLGAVMMFCCLVVGTLAFDPQTRSRRGVWVLVFIAAFVMLAASRSKTSLSIFLATIAITPLLLVFLKLRPRVIQAIVAALVASLLAALFGWTAICMAQGLDPLAPIRGVTFTQRTDVWTFVWGEVAKHPLQGSGFGSFWDIDPQRQPSLHRGLWFGSDTEVANEAHNGYLDLLASTGVIGLALALVLLFAWIGRGLALLRRGLLSADPRDRGSFPADVTLGLFPLLIFAHNWMESTYFVANNMFGMLILLVGIDLDLRFALSPSPFRGVAGPLERRR